jgi:hypothetical protein
MEIDPIVGALAATVTALAGVLYRTLLQRAERAERDAEFWRNQVLTQIGKTDLALDEAERRKR